MSLIHLILTSDCVSQRLFKTKTRIKPMKSLDPTQAAIILLMMPFHQLRIRPAGVMMSMRLIGAKKVKELKSMIIWPT